MITLLCLSYLFAYPNMRGLLYHVAVPTTGLNPGRGGWGGGGLFYLSHIGMCCAKGYHFCAFLIWKLV